MTIIFRAVILMMFVAVLRQAQHDNIVLHNASLSLFSIIVFSFYTEEADNCDRHAKGDDNSGK